MKIIWIMFFEYPYFGSNLGMFDKLKVYPSFEVSITIIPRGSYFVIYFYDY